MTPDATAGPAGSTADSGVQERRSGGVALLERPPVPDEVPARHRLRIHSSLRHPGPAWPLTVFLLAFPIWWLLGFATIGFLLITIPMAYQLLGQRQVKTPAGFGFMILFLIWFAASAVVITVNAPQALPEHGVGKLIPFAYTLWCYGAFAIIAIWVGNLSEDALSDTAGLRLFSAIFIVTVCGGYLGLILPHLSFPSALALALPGPVRNNAFVKLLTHLNTAEVQTFLGFVTPRPRAPFNYTNTWGGALGMTLPFFLAHWGGKESRLKRRWLPVMLFLALIPAVASLNRGLWGGVLAMGAYMLIRMAMRGQGHRLLAAVAVLGIGAGIFMLSPGGALVKTRLGAQNSSTDGRTHLATIGVTTMLQGSPLLGFGKSHTLSGSFHSIAGGRSAECRLCAPPGLGTQGLLWYLLYAHGLIGAALFIAFICSRVFRAIPRPDPISVAFVCAAIYLCLTSFVYDLMSGPLYMFAIGLGLAWRVERRSRRAASRNVIA